MEQYDLHAYEALGFWTIVLTRVTLRDDGHYQRDLIYKGDHVSIDEDDPVIRAHILLHQVTHDLGWAASQDAPIVPSHVGH